MITNSSEFESIVDSSMLNEGETDTYSACDSQRFETIEGPETTLSRFSVIICTYNSKRYNDTIDSIESVLNQSHPNVEIILVVDRNKEIYQKFSARYKDYSSIKVLFNDKCPGLSGSRNHGLTQASGDIIAFLDDDAIADVHWLEQLQHMYSHEEVLGCGGPISPLWIAGEAEWIPEEFYWVMGCTYKGFNNIKRPIRSNFGSNMSFRSIAFNDERFDINAGMKDEKGVGEEVDLSLRLLKKFPSNYVYHCPDAIVYHKIFDFRKSVKHLFNRCYQYGLCIGGCSRDLYIKPDNVAQEDKNMAIYLIMGAIPERLMGILSGKNNKHGVVREFVQFAIMILSSITIVIGMFFGMLKDLFKSVLRL